MIALLQSNQSVLNPAGPQAASIDSLWNVMLYTLSTVFVIVLAFLIVAAFRRRERVGFDNIVTSDPQQERRMSFTVLSAVILSAIILFVLLVTSFLTGRQLYAISNSPNVLSITVTAHQWWWQIEYDDPSPDRIVTTANEIHLPVQRSVLVRLKSSDVIHSFWVPNLHGKTDLVPGHETTTWLRVDKSGLYRGQCAEFCGHQHAHMAFTVVAETDREFEAWRDHQLQSAAEPSTPQQSRGKQVFLTSACVLCHHISGTDAGSNAGPDLSHIASRSTIAAGTVANNRQNLAAWVVNSQHLKPGNNMPPNALRPEDLQALLDYLESLK